MNKVFPLKCRITNAAEVTRVDVYDDIGEGGWFSEGLTAKGFAAQLGKVTGALEVHINSAGGDVFDGIAIGNAIRGHAGPVTTVVDGLAASIASVIAQAGGDRVVQPGSMMMIHDAFGMCVGDAGDMTAMAATLDKVSGNIADIYAGRAGNDAEHWRGQMRAETWYTADEAVAAGLADRLGEGGAEMPASLDVAAFAAIPGRIAAALRSVPQARPRPRKKAKRNAAAGACCDQCGPDCACAADVTAMASKVLEVVRAELRDELHFSAAAADESAWDASKAWAAGAAADDPAAFYNAICAGKKAGDPATQAAHALPHHYHPGAAPNRAGVSNALARLDSTQGLTNRAAAEKHLKAHQSAMGGGSDDTNHAWTPDAFLAALTKGEAT